MRRRELLEYCASSVIIYKRGDKFDTMIRETKKMDDLRYKPLYSMAEVSRYVRVQHATLRSWVQAKNESLLIPATHHSIAPLSFINLIESHVLLALRKTHRVPMQKIREAIEWMKKTYEFNHPLAEIDLETDGKEVFVREFGFPISASRGGQIGIDAMLSRYLKRIERDPQNIPIRFYPLTYETSPKLIVMDPAIAFGRPVIKGTRITTPIVFERYSGGESLQDIAADYDLEIALVEEALRCEIEQRAAA